MRLIRRILCVALLFTAPSVFSQTQTPKPSQPLTLDEVIRLAEANEPTFAAAAAEGRATALRAEGCPRRPPALRHLPQPIPLHAVQPDRSDHYPGRDQPVSARLHRQQRRPRVLQPGLRHRNPGPGSVHCRASRRCQRRPSARRRLEVARRGLVQTVVGLFYGSGAANQKIAVAQRALDEANSFLDITTKRENAREAAHADVIKARSASSNASAISRTRS